MKKKIPDAQECLECGMRTVDDEVLHPRCPECGANYANTWSVRVYKKVRGVRE